MSSWDDPTSSAVAGLEYQREIDMVWGNYGIIDQGELKGTTESPVRFIR
jgi:hypothetical protein